MQETKDVVILIAEIGNGIGKSLENKTWEAGDIMNFMPAATAFFPALANCTDIPSEIANSNDADREDLVNAFCAKFSITQAAAEVAVEKAIAVAVAVWNLIK